MIYVILGIVWVVFLVIFGVMSLTEGHWVMFLFGIVFPLFWIIGAFMPDRRGEDRVQEQF